MPVFQAIGWLERYSRHCRAVPGRATSRRASRVSQAAPGLIGNGAATGCTPDNSAAGGAAPSRAVAISRA